jgi:hypothetical protein
MFMKGERLGWAFRGLASTLAGAEKHGMAFWLCGGVFQDENMEKDIRIELRDAVVVTRHSIFLRLENQLFEILTLS